MLVFNCFLPFMTLLSATIVVIRLNQHGTSKELRRLVINRHILYLFLYVVNAIFNFGDLFNKEIAQSDYVDLFNTFTIWSYPIVGFALMCVRIFEPYMFMALKESFCCFKTNQKKKYSSESLGSFVNSAMNIELVCLILVGVRHYMKSEESTTEEEGYAVERKSISKIAVSNIKFKNIEKWEVDNNILQTQNSRIQAESFIDDNEEDKNMFLSKRFTNDARQSLKLTGTSMNSEVYLSINKNT